MYYQNEVEKKERRKIIAGATIAVALILVLIIAIIVVAVKKSGHSNDVANETNTSFELEETASSAEETEVQDKNEEQIESDEQTTESLVGAISSEKTSSSDEQDNEETEDLSIITNTNEEMPTTGPEEILPIAVLAGMIVTYSYSAILAKRN